MAQAPDTIGNWDSTQLQKVVRELILQNAPDHLPSLTVDDLTVVGTLTAQSKVVYSLRSLLNIFGAAGQPAYTNGWANGGAPYRSAGYIRTEDGWVRLFGAIKSGSIASSAVPLPPGNWPVGTSRHAVVSNGAFGIVDVTSTGLIIPQSPSVNTLVSLDGIQFKAA